MTPWAAIGEAVAFAQELYRNWRAGKPQRAAEQRNEDYARDIDANAQAAAAGDAATLTQDFEAERQAAIRRGDLAPGPADELRQLP